MVWPIRSFVNTHSLYPQGLLTAVLRWAIQHFNRAIFENIDLLISAVCLLFPFIRIDLRLFYFSPFHVHMFISVLLSCVACFLLSNLSIWFILFCFLFHWQQSHGRTGLLTHTTLFCAVMCMVDVAEKCHRHTKTCSPNRAYMVPKPIHITQSDRSAFLQSIEVLVECIAVPFTLLIYGKAKGIPTQPCILHRRTLWILLRFGGRSSHFFGATCPYFVHACWCIDTFRSLYFYRSIIITTHAHSPPKFLCYLFLVAFSLTISTLNITQFFVRRYSLAQKVRWTCCTHRHYLITCM